MLCHVLLRSFRGLLAGLFELSITAFANTSALLYRRHIGLLRRAVVTVDLEGRERRVCLPFHNELTTIARQIICTAMRQLQKPKMKYKPYMTGDARKVKRNRRSTQTTYQAAAATVVLSQEKAKLASASITVCDGLVVLPGGVLLFRFLWKKNPNKVSAVGGMSNSQPPELKSNLFQLCSSRP